MGSQIVRLLCLKLLLCCHIKRRSIDCGICVGGELALYFLILKNFAMVNQPIPFSRNRSERTSICLQPQYVGKSPQKRENSIFCLSCSIFVSRRLVLDFRQSVSLFTGRVYFYLYGTAGRWWSGWWLGKERFYSDKEIWSIYYRLIWWQNKKGHWQVSPVHSSRGPNKRGKWNN